MQALVGVRQSSTFYAVLYAMIIGLIIIIIILLGLLGVNVWTGVLVDNLDTGVDIPDIVVEPNIIFDPQLDVNVSCPAKPACTQFLYAHPFVCGMSLGCEGNHSLVAADEYSYTLSVFNPNDQTVQFSKKVSMTKPPGSQLPGPVFPSSPPDVLQNCQALEMSCQEIRNLMILERSNKNNRKRSTKRDIGPFIKGIVSLVSPVELVVWGTQTSARNSFVEPLAGDRRSYDGDGGDGYEPPPSGPQFLLTRTDAITFDKELVPALCIQTDSPPLLLKK